ncbi:hypothetical protein [Streptomyces cavernae]|uniref:hypothetical protein n=1 Tax=Streptomyces cavernae TaxID=2259034 RepID=UPI000FEB5E8A|nr:hypothetical protein [Streptomyces cavernae]
MVLFGLLFAHGLHGESAAGHLAAGVTASLAVDAPAPPADHEHHQHQGGADGELADSAHNCAPSQPNAAPDVPPPGDSFLEVTALCRLLPYSGMRSGMTDPVTRPVTATSVLRI